MNKFSIVLLLLIGHTTSYSQQGFNRKYNLDTVASLAFGSVLYENDTLYTFGPAKLLGDTTSGLMFARLDTLGNILDQKIYYDSAENDFAIYEPGCFIRLSDHSGFMASGRFMGQVMVFLIKYDNIGNIIYFKKYNNGICGGRIEDVMELKDGFLIAGARSTYIYLMKTDLNGNELWIKKYESPERLMGLGNILKSGSDFKLGGSTTNLVGAVPVQQIKNTTVIITVDSTGSEISRWETPQTVEETGIGTLFKLDNGNWAYHTSRLVFSTNYNLWLSHPKFVIRDSNFNLIKQQTFGAAITNRNNILNGIQLSDGGWLLSGNYAQSRNSGWLIRLNSEGDSIWSRVDTAYWGPIPGFPDSIYGTESYLRSAVELPGGSLVIAGYCNIYKPAPERSWAWLIKVDKNGCMDTLLCSPVSNVLVPAEKPLKISVFPNPAVESVTFSEIPSPQVTQIQILDITGRVVHDYTLPPNQNAYTWAVGNTRPGIFFYRLTGNGQTVCSGKLVVIR